MRVPSLPPAPTGRPKPARGTAPGTPPTPRQALKGRTSGRPVPPMTTPRHRTTHPPTPAHFIPHPRINTTTNPGRDSSCLPSPSHTPCCWHASSPLPPFHGALKPLGLASRQRRPLQKSRGLRPHVLRSKVQLRNAPGVSGNHAPNVRILFHDGARVPMSKPGRNPDRIPTIARMDFSRPLRSRRKDAKTSRHEARTSTLPPLRLCVFA